MVFIRARTFCCCLPVRLGIFAVTILGLLVGGSLSIIGWLEVKHMGQSPLSRAAEIALCLQTVMFTLLALLSILGFAALALGRRNLLVVYGVALLVHLFGSVGSGSFTIYALFHEDLLECDAPATPEQCRKRNVTIQAVATTFFVFMWLFQFYGVVLVANIVDQAEEQQVEKETPHPPPHHDEPVATKNDVAASFRFTTYNSFTGSSYPFSQPSTFDPPGHNMV